MADAGGRANAVVCFMSSAVLSVSLLGRFSLEWNVFVSDTIGSFHVPDYVASAQIKWDQSPRDCNSFVFASSTSASAATASLFISNISSDAFNLAFTVFILVSFSVTIRRALAASA